MKSRHFLGITLLIFGGVLAAGGLWQLLQTDEFRAVASFQVPEAPPTYSGPYFILLEFEALQSRPILTNVIASLHLNERWGKKYNHGQRLSNSEAEEMLRAHLDLRNIRNTRVIEIITYDDDPEEAAKLANAISREYRQFRSEESRRRAQELQPGIIADPIMTLMDVAIPEYRPVRPNRYRAGTMLGFASFLMIAGMFCWNNRAGLETGAPVL